MDTLVRPPVDEPTGTAEPRRRRRWPWVVGIAMTVTLLSLAIAATVWLNSYQPMRTGNGGLYVDPAHSVKVGDFSPPTGDTFAQYDVTYADQATFRFGFTISNSGRIPITIESVRPPWCASCVFPMEYVGTEVGPVVGPTKYLPRDATPFAPFSLGPAEDRFVVITARFDHCQDLGPNSIAGFNHVVVRYRTGWTEQTTDLPLPYTLDVARESACPA
jgi:hypothetical protein